MAIGTLSVYDLSRCIQGSSGKPCVKREKVKKLRIATGAGFKDCNLAIKESNGDLDKAIEILRVKGISKASKKMSRVEESDCCEHEQSKYEDDTRYDSSEFRECGGNRNGSSCGAHTTATGRRGDALLHFRNDGYVMDVRIIF